MVGYPVRTAARALTSHQGNYMIPTPYPRPAPWPIFSTTCSGLVNCHEIGFGLQKTSAWSKTSTEIRAQYREFGKVKSAKWAVAVHLHLVCYTDNSVLLSKRPAAPMINIHELVWAQSAASGKPVENWSIVFFFYFFFESIRHHIGYIYKTNITIFRSSSRSSSSSSSSYQL